MKASGITAIALVVPVVSACGDTTVTTEPATTAPLTKPTTTNAAPVTAALPTSVAATTPALATASAGPLPFAGRTLTVFVYSGLTEDTFRNVYAPAFEKATGAKLVLSPGWWDAAAKLQSSPDDQPPFDLVETDPIQGFPGIRQNLFQKIDTSKIPNAKNFAPVLI